MLPVQQLSGRQQCKSSHFYTYKGVNHVWCTATGEVPNLFAKDELVGIMEAVTPRAKRAGKPLTPAGLWAFFLDSVRVNLHLVLTMSPVGGSFRERLRK
jgi:hypothetical protein